MKRRKTRDTGILIDADGTERPIRWRPTVTDQG